jgi:hypothetical protein
MQLTEWDAKVLQRLIENAAPDGLCDPTDLQHATESILPRLADFTTGKATGYDDAEATAAA